VRVGPFEKKEEADRQKEKLDASGVETALVRVQR
jgi:cell division protein FtsN